MLDIRPPAYRYCPFCAGALSDFVDDNRRRQRCERCGWIYYPHVGSSATAVIVRGTDVLLVRRRREPFPDTWMCPSGFVEFGEHPTETVRREVLEETGLVAEAVDLIDVVQSDDDPRLPGHFVFFYRVTVGDGRLTTDRHENSDVRWFHLDRVPPIHWHLQERALSQARRIPGDSRSVESLGTSTT